MPGAQIEGDILDRRQRRLVPTPKRLVYILEMPKGDKGGWPPPLLGDA
jgi:hypothetical protein